MPDVTNVTLHCSSSIAALMFADSESSLHRTVCVSSSVLKSFKFLLFIHFCPAPLLDRWAKSNNAKVVIHPRNIDCVMIQWNSLCVCSWTQTGSYTIKWLYKCILHPSIWHLSVFLFFFYQHLQFMLCRLVSHVKWENASTDLILTGCQITKRYGDSFDFYCVKNKIQSHWRHDSLHWQAMTDWIANN